MPVSRASLRIAGVAKMDRPLEALVAFGVTNGSTLVFCFAKVGLAGLDFLPASSGVSMTTKMAPTSMISPSSPIRSRTLPATGEEISTVALSVITSSRG